MQRSLRSRYLVARFGIPRRSALTAAQEMSICVWKAAHVVIVDMLQRLPGMGVIQSPAFGHSRQYPLPFLSRRLTRNGAKLWWLLHPAELHQ